jgi:lipopolysaccharide biosynthesis protein
MPAEGRAMTRAVIMAHFDPEGVVDDYVLAALREYRRVADRLVLVSASARELPCADRGLVDEFIPRDNSGYDFCSWRAGIESIASLDGIDELICVNDSVYGPMSDLAPVLADPRVARADAWGMCFSGEGSAARRHPSALHLQSWFVAMRRPVLRSAAFRDFWAGVVPLPTKDEIVDRYELGFSESLSRRGFVLSAIHDPRTAPASAWGAVLPMLSPLRPRRALAIVRKRGWDVRRTNPSLLRPVSLVRDGVPYVKIGLFRDNHARLDLARVEREIGSLCGYDMGLIRRHQERLARAGILGRPSR